MNEWQPIETACRRRYLLTLKQRDRIFAMKTDIANVGNGADLFPYCFQDVKKTRRRFK